MRLRILAVAAALPLMVGGLAGPAEAFGWDRYGPGDPDPYAYRYSPRGYYPYYSSSYWRPGRYVRRRRGIKSPRYYPAWGYYKRHWRNKRWHERRYGRIPFWYY